MGGDLYDYSHLPPFLREYYIKRNAYKREASQKYRAKKRVKEIYDKFYTKKN